MAVIFCLSGTGNSLYVAQQIAKDLQVPCTIKSVSSYLENPQPITDQVVGIVCPVYCFGLPPLVAQLAQSLQAKPSYCFGVITMGGNQGRALKQLQDILGQRSIKLSYGATVAMPDNFFAKPEQAPAVLAKAEGAIAKIAQDIANRTLDTGKCSEKWLWRLAGQAGCWWFMHNVQHVDQLAAGDSCIGCGKCQAVCPTNNITMVDGKPSFGTSCATCYGCINHCPVQAISIGRSKGQKQYVNPNITIEMLKALKE